jgi:hypothetical protein
MGLEVNDMFIDDEDDEAFLRRIIFPEEDRHLFTTTPWRGGFRWFRSQNVVPVEQWRRRHERKEEEVNAPRQAKSPGSSRYGIEMPNSFCERLRF